MTDNPSSGGDFDDVFALLKLQLDQAAFVAQLDAVRARVDDFAEAATAAFLQGDEAAQAYIESLRTVKNETYSGLDLTKVSNEVLNEQAQILARVDAEVTKLAADYNTLGDARAGATQGGADMFGGQQKYLGYGVEQGLIGPAEAEGEGGGGGSTFGLARGARGLGMLAGNSQAGQGVASVLYVATAFQQLDDFLKPLNETLLKSGGLLPPLTEGFAGLGVPMAGLVGVIVPLAAGVAAAAVVITAFNNEIRDSEKALQASLSAYHVYLTAIAGGTTEELRTKLAAATETQTGADTEVKTLSEKVAYGIATAFKEGGGIEVVALQQTQGWKDLTKQLEEAQTAAKKAAAEVQGYNQALADPRVQANDAAAAALKSTQEEADLKKQLAADNKLSTAAIMDTKTALEGDIATRQQSNAELAAAKQAAMDAGASAESIQNLTQAIATNDAAIKLDQERIDNFNNVAYGLADAAEQAAAAVKLQTEITKEHVSFVEQENKLRTAGTEAQFGTARLGVQSKIVGAQTELDQLAQTGGQRSLSTVELDRITELTALLAEYNAQLAELDANIKPIVDARDALNNLEKASEDFAAKQKSLQDALQLQQDSARAKELQAEEQYTQGSLQDVQQREKIKLDESRRETQLTQDTADKIVDIMNSLTNRENQLTEDFSRQQQDDITKANQDQDKLIRNAHNQQREDEIAHNSRLREIRQGDQVADQRALLDRNFLKLFEDRQSKAQAEQQENDSYVAREEKLSRTLANQESELAISLANEQKQQRLAYQRKFEDLQQQAAQDEIQVNLAESRKRAQLRQSEQDQLQDLTTSENNKIAILRQNLQNELTLYGQQEQAKLTIAQQTTDAIIAYNTAALQAAFAANPGAVGSAGAGVIGGGGQTSYMYADGGNFNANRGFMMSEDGVPEALRFGNRGYNVNGAAMVYPLQGGSVTPVGGGGDRVFAPVINLYGTTSEPLTPELIKATVYDVWDEVMNDNE